MQKRRLGQTDILVSLIGLGTVKFGRNQGVKYPTSFSLPTDNEILSLLDLARDLGINLLDTAPAYGSSEERLGKALKHHSHDWIICSKVGEEFINGHSHFDFSRAAVIASIERSLKRLGRDYLDIVLVHSNGDDENIIKQDQVFSVLEELKSAGKIRAYGMSTKTVQGGLATIQQSDLAMVTYHPSYTEEREVISAALNLQKGIFIKKALNSGHLDPREALQFVLNEPGVTSVILGTLNPNHLQQNVQLSNFFPK